MQPGDTAKVFTALYFEVLTNKMLCVTDMKYMYMYMVEIIKTPYMELSAILPLQK